MGVSLLPLDQIHLLHMVREKDGTLSRRTPPTLDFWAHFEHITTKVLKGWTFAHTYTVFKVRQIIDLKWEALQLTSLFQHEASYRTLIDIVLSGLRGISNGLNHTTLQLAHEFELASVQRPVGIHTTNAVFYLLGIADYFVVTAGSNQADGIRSTVL